jgi:hypothetical protein
LANPFAWPEKIPAGDTTALRERFPTWGHKISDQTVGNILRWQGIAPAPKRSQSTTWKKFIAAHLAVLAGTDFFTVEVLTWRSRHLLCAVLHSVGIQARHSRRSDDEPDGGMDGANCPECGRP